jgi:type 1 glutamine amidotransferase
MRVLIVLCALSLLAAPAPASAAKRKPPRVLVYSGTAGFHHLSIPYSVATLHRLARLTKRFSVKAIAKPEELTAARLRKSDIVLWNSTTGAESPFTDAQEQAYMRFVGCGGGHMGVHASTDSYKDWKGWAELTGAFFKSHPITPTSALDDQTPEYEGWGEPEAAILIKDKTSKITAPWQPSDAFFLHDEFYALDRDPAKTLTDFHAVLAFGGFTDQAVQAAYGSNYADEQPLAWTGSYRHLNRIYYTNLGHSTSTWYRPDYQDSLVEAIAWVGRKRPKASCLKETTR